MLPVFSLRCIQLHAQAHMQNGLHMWFIACAKVFQQFFVIIFLVMRFPNSQNQSSINCKRVVACASLDLVMDLYNC